MANDRTVLNDEDITTTWRRSGATAPGVHADPDTTDADADDTDTTDGDSDSTDS